MTDEPEAEETTEARRRARQTLAKAAAEYADAWEATASALCTGYVAVFEFTTAEGRYCLWLTGNGRAPDDNHSEGLDAWRVDGMVRQVIRDINRKNTASE